MRTRYQDPYASRLSDIAPKLPKSLKISSKVSKKGEKAYKKTSNTQKHQITVTQQKNIVQRLVKNVKDATLPPLEPSRNVPTHDDMSLSLLRTHPHPKKRPQNDKI